MTEKMTLQQVRDKLASWLGGSEACLDARNSQERSPLGMRYVAPLIGGLLDAAIDAAMHNSAREDGE